MKWLIFGTLRYYDKLISQTLQIDTSKSWTSECVCSKQEDTNLCQSAVLIHEIHVFHNAYSTMDLRRYE